MTTFALVHGAWHGAWCWERLAPELERRGHAVVAPDLPCDDPDATFADYAAVVVAALEGTDDDVVLVGHSLGGMTIPLVAAQRPARTLAYVCALVPIPGAGLVDQLRAERATFLPAYRDGIEATEDGRASRWVDFAIARATLYGDCTEADARRAFDRLRPQSDAPNRVPCPLAALPDVETVSIVCAADGIVAPDWSRHVARERLGVAPVELAGGHSPFLSRPAELAALLDGQAA